MTPVRHNWPAIAVATLVYFALGSAWFIPLQTPWLAGIGKTEQQIMDAGIPMWITFGSAAVTTFVIAIFLSWLIQLTGTTSALGGIKIAAWAWLGLVFTTWSTEYAFEARALRLLAITTGYCLTGMLLMGAILGAWKRRVA